MTSGHRERGTGVRAVAAVLPERPPARERGDAWPRKPECVRRGGPGGADLPILVEKLLSLQHAVPVLRSRSPVPWRAGGG